MLNIPDKKKKLFHVLLYVSGSIACYKACEFASLLVQKGYEVQTMASLGALRFLQPAVFEGLTHRPLLTDIFGGKPDYIPHITLAQNWADVIIAYPASANCINRLASGLCDDLFGAVCLANNYKHPLLLAPAMNSEMFAHPAVQDALKKLASWGTVILPTEAGRLACGAVGQGKLLSPERAVRAIDEVVVNPIPHSCEYKTVGKNLRILITGGGCREPIDSVRCVTNMSTGKTASFLTDFFVSRGAVVTYLAAEQSVLPSVLQNGDHPCLRCITYRTAADLAAAMEKELSEHAYDAVIHAAAVSDFQPVKVIVNGIEFPVKNVPGKISSDSNLSMTFEPVPKIADRIRIWAAVGNPSGKTVIVCFKLTAGSDRSDRMKASGRLFSKGNIDYVVSNDLSELTGEEHLFELFGNYSDDTEKSVSVCTGRTLSDLAEALASVL